MLGRSRISGLMDMNRLGAALARPGMDTRVTSSYAYANDESFYDSAHGVFVNVTLAPSGQVLNARVPSIYAGKGFGLYARIHKDDELLLLIPNGDPAEGAVVIDRLWSQADTPPSEIGTDEDEVMLIVEKDKALRLKTTGSGKVEIDSDATVTIAVGATSKVTIDKDSIAVDAGGNPVNIDGSDIVLNGGGAKVSRVGDATQGHTHTLSGTAGPYPINGTALLKTDKMAEGAAKVKA